MARLPLRVIAPALVAAVVPLKLKLLKLAGPICGAAPVRSTVPVAVKAPTLFVVQTPAPVPVTVIVLPLSTNVPAVLVNVPIEIGVEAVRVVAAAGAVIQGARDRESGVARHRRAARKGQVAANGGNPGHGHGPAAAQGQMVISHRQHRLGRAIVIDRVAAGRRRQRRDPRSPAQVQRRVRPLGQCAAAGQRGAHRQRAVFWLSPADRHARNGQRPAKEF